MTRPRIPSIRMRWIGLAVLIVAGTLFALTRPVEDELPDSDLGYTPQGDVHAMLLAERLFGDLTQTFTSPATAMEELPPYPGSHDHLDGILEYYQDNVASLRDGRLCLTSDGCPRRDHIALAGLEALLFHAERLSRLEAEEELTEVNLRRFRADAMDLHAETLERLAGTFSGDGADVFRQGARLTRLGAIATRSVAEEDRDRHQEEALAVLEYALQTSVGLGMAGGPGGELSRSLVRVQGAQMLDSRTVQPDALLQLMAHMFGSLAPMSGDQSLALDVLDEHLLNNYAGTTSTLRWMMIRQLDPPPAREEE